MAQIDVVEAPPGTLLPVSNNEATGYHTCAGCKMGHYGRPLSVSDGQQYCSEECRVAALAATNPWGIWFGLESSLIEYGYRWPAREGHWCGTYDDFWDIFIERHGPPSAFSKYRCALPRTGPVLFTAAYARRIEFRDTPVLWCAVEDDDHAGTRTAAFIEAHVRVHRSIPVNGREVLRLFLTDARREAGWTEATKRGRGGSIILRFDPKLAVRRRKKKEAAVRAVVASGNIPQDPVVRLYEILTSPPVNTWDIRSRPPHPYYHRAGWGRSSRERTWDSCRPAWFSAIADHYTWLRKNPKFLPSKPASLKEDRENRSYVSALLESVPYLRGIKSSHLSGPAFASFVQRELRRLRIKIPPSRRKP